MVCRASHQDIRILPQQVKGRNSLRGNINVEFFSSRCDFHDQKNLSCITARTRTTWSCSYLHVYKMRGMTLRVCAPCASANVSQFEPFSSRDCRVSVSTVLSNSILFAKEVSRQFLRRRERTPECSKHSRMERSLIQDARTRLTHRDSSMVLGLYIFEASSM